MTHDLDYPRLRVALEFLHGANAEGKLLMLKNLTVNNGGIWPLPDAPEHKRPAWYEVQLLGISATADSPDMLPINWCRAAANALRAAPQTGEAA